jgi:hypothetical protein
MQIYIVVLGLVFFMANYLNDFRKTLTKVRQAELRSRIIFTRLRVKILIWSQFPGFPNKVASKRFKNQDK